MSADQILALAFYGGVIATTLLGGWCSRRTKQNRRVRRPTTRHPWPRQGHDEVRGYFATSERPGPECAGKVG